MLLCVDAVEGIMCVTDKAVKAALAEGMPICLLITKVAPPPPLFPLLLICLSDFSLSFFVSWNVCS